MASVLVTGFEPVLLARESADGNSRLAPHNLVSSWFWVYGDDPRPVPYRDLQKVWSVEGGEYDPEIMALFDENNDGWLVDQELVIDNEEKESLIVGRLEGLGLDNPRIEAETRAYSISHNVTDGEWATKDCRTCHGSDSLITQPTMLADRIPGGTMPTFVGDSSVETPG